MDKQIKLKTETEHMLYQAYSENQKYNEKLKAENEKLKLTITKMENQILELSDQVKLLSERNEMDTSRNATTTKESSTQATDYQTDEEELARETEWIRAKTRKKRKLNTSPEHHQSRNDSTTYNEKKTKKVPPPPPIIVDDVSNYQSFYDLLTEGQANDYFRIKMLNGNNVKINANNDESYRTITRILSAGNFLWHSFENKQERPVKVMAKKLHFTCKPERIIEDLQNKGFKVENVVNKLKWKSKEPLNMFLLSFKNGEDINKIYGITSILGCKVEIHPVKSSKLIPQCKRCQIYGHTQKYCSREPRCVKCTGKHLSIECNKPAEQKPKCIHCGEAHPANYRGCIVAKEMQAIRNKTGKNKSAVSQSVSQPHISGNSKKNPPVRKQLVKAFEPNKENPNKKVTYAQVASYSNNMNPSDPAKNINKDFETKLDKILRIMSSFDGRLQKLENCNNKAILKQYNESTT